MILRPIYLINSTSSSLGSYPVEIRTKSMNQVINMSNDDSDVYIFKPNGKPNKFTGQYVIVNHRPERNWFKFWVSKISY